MAVAGSGISFDGSIRCSTLSSNFGSSAQFVLQGFFFINVDSEHFSIGVDFFWFRLSADCSQLPVSVC